MSVNWPSSLLIAKWATTLLSSILGLGRNPLPCSRGSNNCLLIIEDGFSKFISMITLRDMNAGHIVRALQIVTDNASYFKEYVMTDLCFAWVVKHITTSLYYTCPNIVEQVNKNVKVALKIFHNMYHHSWDQNLPELNCYFNSAPHSATGFSPCKIFLCRELPVPRLNVWVIRPEIMESNNNSEFTKRAKDIQS
ncbi:hypothetical protein PR048_011396 [Dryococelus australis]|uniref:Integrase catalytic domain-containing protein n=1 Tax=Dryococelus australis TaxID=614101 RepID=A0ABQ9HLM5_9NEOP|nr:hypothetical protein PR048_011396 [Dryococelus australis]